MAERDVFAQDSGRGEDRVSVLERVRQFRQIRPTLLILTVAATLASPLVGLFLAGWAGALLGLALSVFSLLLGVIAVTRHWEVEREIRR